MRRILLLLLAWAAFGAVVPCAPAAAHRPGQPAALAMPHGHCPDSGTAAAHNCLGCALAPDRIADVAAVPIAGDVPGLAVVALILPEHRTGFDPPPPRPRG